MRIYLITPLLTLLLFLFACNERDSRAKQKEESNNYKGDTLKLLNTQKEYKLPNDEFRDKVLSKMSHSKDTWLDTLIAMLDNKGLSFCQFIKQQFVLDDSCFAVAKAKYPDPSMQIEMGKTYDKALGIAQPKYFKSIGISYRLGDLASWKYAFNDTIKNFCGRY